MPFQSQNNANPQQIYLLLYNQNTQEVYKIALKNSKNNLNEEDFSQIDDPNLDQLNSMGVLNSKAIGNNFAFSLRVSGPNND